MASSSTDMKAHLNQPEQNLPPSSAVIVVFDHLMDHDVYRFMTQVMRDLMPLGFDHFLGHSSTDLNLHQLNINLVTKLRAHEKATLDEIENCTRDIKTAISNFHQNTNLREQFFYCLGEKKFKCTTMLQDQLYNQLIIRYVADFLITSFPFTSKELSDWVDQEGNSFIRQLLTFPGAYYRHHMDLQEMGVSFDGMIEHELSLQLEENLKRSLTAPGLSSQSFDPQSLEVQIQRQSDCITSKILAQDSQFVTYLDFSGLLNLRENLLKAPSQSTKFQFFYVTNLPPSVPRIDSMVNLFSPDDKKSNMEFLDLCKKQGSGLNIQILNGLDKSQQELSIIIREEVKRFKQVSNAIMKPAGFFHSMSSGPYGRLLGITNKPMQTQRMLKCSFIGDPAVGKTALLTQLNDKKFAEKYFPTIGMDSVQIHAPRPINLMYYCDISGQKLYNDLFPTYIRGSDILVIVFNLSQRDTFETLPDWLNASKKSEKENVKIILVANKADRAETVSVTQEEIEQFMTQWNEDPANAQHRINAFVITSAKTRQGLDSLERLILNDLETTCNLTMTETSSPGI